MTRTLVVVSLAMTLMACPKKPTPAQLAAGAYAELAARRSPQAADYTTAGDQPTVDLSGGEPAEGEYRACGENIGTLDWVRTAPVAETKLANGDRRVELSLDLCMRPETSDACRRPNVYTVVAQLRMEDGGAWKVVGSTCALRSGVR